jgi:hypothetical protein
VLPSIRLPSKQNLIRLTSCPPVSEYLLERTTEKVDRNAVLDLGAMYKHLGKQAGHSLSYQATLKVEKNTSANPTLKVLQRIEDQTQLRANVEREESGESMVLIVPNEPG